jgi:chromosome segregation ATPase
MSIFGARIKDISDDPLNVYSILTNADSVLTLQAAFELKKDEFIERTVNDEDYAEARKVIFDFAKNQYVDVVSEQLKAEEKKLRNLENELGSLERDQVKMERSSRSNKQLIAEEREKIELLNNELVSLSTEILGQSNRQGSMASGEVTEQSSDYIKDLEKQKKKVSKDIEASERKISKAEKEIDDNQRETPKNTNLQESAREEVSRQEAIVQEYTDKLNTIKNYK